MRLVWAARGPPPRLPSGKFLKQGGSSVTCSQFPAAGITPFAQRAKGGVRAGRAVPDSGHSAGRAPGSGRVEAVPDGI